MEKHSTPAEREAYAASRARRAEFVKLVLRYRDRAAQLYREPLPDDAKRAAKAKLFAELDADYGQLKAKEWRGFAGYDRFFAGMNNAHLASVATYEALVPTFRALLAREGGDLPKFYAAVKELAQMPKPERDRALAELVRR
jgi:predicted aminopeptidase